MRAVHIPAAGQQPTIADIPRPVVTDDTVLVRVKAVGLNAIDNAIAAGMFAEMMPHEYPLVLGRDAAGIVEAVGAGVRHVQIGDEVFGHVLLAPPITAGTLAEYVLLPGAAVARKPAGLDFVAAAALPLAGAAAVAAVDAIALQPGQAVLVNGASGGVGSYVVQLLVARGVTVFATGTEVDIERLHGLGADTVIDHTAAPVIEQLLAAHPQGVDALINLAGYVTADVPLGAVRRGGAVASTTPAPDEESAAAAGVSLTNVMAGPVREVIAPLADQAAAGTLKIGISSVLPLDRAIEGLTTLANGQSHGKIVVTID